MEGDPFDLVLYIPVQFISAKFLSSCHNISMFFYYNIEILYGGITAPVFSKGLFPWFEFDNTMLVNFVKAQFDFMVADFYPSRKKYAKFRETCTHHFSVLKITPFNYMKPSWYHIICQCYYWKTLIYKDFDNLSISLVVLIIIIYHMLALCYVKIFLITNTSNKLLFCSTISNVSC